VILVTGFGPFGEIRDNPSGRLARAVHGARLGGHTVVGLTLPVAYDRGLRMALRHASAADCAAVIGLGVAAGRSGIEVERVARNRANETPDVDGVVPAIVEPGGPSEVRASADVEALAAELGAGLSDDAGAYVCNAWLYRLTRGLPGTPVAFVHVPLCGVPTERFLDGLDRWLRR